MAACTWQRSLPQGLEHALERRTPDQSRPLRSPRYHTNLWHQLGCHTTGSKRAPSIFRRALAGRVGRKRTCDFSSVRLGRIRVYRERRRTGLASAAATNTESVAALGTVDIVKLPLSLNGPMASVTKTNALNVPLIRTEP